MFDRRITMNADAEARRQGKNLDGSPRRETEEVSAKNQAHEQKAYARTDGGTVLGATDPGSPKAPGDSWQKSIAIDLLEAEILRVRKFNDELQEANNRYLERARSAERSLLDAAILHGKSVREVTDVTAELQDSRNQLKKVQAELDAVHIVAKAAGFKITVLRGDDPDFADIINQAFGGGSRFGHFGADS